MTKKELIHILQTDCIDLEDNVSIRVDNGKGRAMDIEFCSLNFVNTKNDFIQYESDSKENTEFCIVIYPKERK